MNQDEKVFHDVCLLLNNNKINYWVCHGTLLGIIREGRLLPWDHDIDFAVWDSEVSKGEISNILVNAGYLEEKIFGDMDCLHFFGKNKKIDIGFYKKNKDIAFIKWLAPSKQPFLIAFKDFVEIIYTNKNINQIELASGVIKRLIHVTLIKTSLIVKKILPHKLKTIFYDALIKRLNYQGYSYPCSLMTFKNIEYNGSIIRVPIESERCLELTYGKNWRTPKKDFIWYEEANNLLESKGG